MRAARGERMKKEKLPTELVIVVIMSLIGFILLFAALTSGGQRPTASGHTLKDVLSDNVIDEQELFLLSGMSCAKIKELVGTDRNICIYLKDENGELLSIGDNIISFGCPGVTVDGARVCG
jgi:hypothetical protein